MSNPFARNEGSAQNFGQQGGYPGASQGGYPGAAQGGYPQGQQGYGSNPYGGQGGAHPYGGQPANAGYGMQNNGGYPQGYGQPGMTPMGGPQKSGSSKAPLFIGIGAAALVLVLVIVIVIARLSDSDSDDSRTTASPSPSYSAPAQPSGTTPHGSNQQGSNQQGKNNPSTSPSQNSGSGKSLFTDSPEGTTTTYEIVDVTPGPVADNNIPTLKVTYLVTNNGSDPEPTNYYQPAFQNNQPLGQPMFFSTSQPSDYEMLPGEEDVEPGKTAQVVVYWGLVDKNAPVEFRNKHWPLDQAMGKKPQTWTWQPK